MKQDELRKELNSISTLNTVGLLGIIFPILAWVFAGIGFAKANNLLNTYEDTGNKKKDVATRKLIHGKSMASVFIIFISIISTVAWFLLLR